MTIYNVLMGTLNTLCLVVCGVCAVPTGYPRIVESPTLKAVEKDRNAVMLCSATGDPEPAISWLKDYVPIDLSDSRFKVLPTGQSTLASSIVHIFTSAKEVILSPVSVGLSLCLSVNLIAAKLLIKSL